MHAFISSIGTSTPEHCYKQSEIAQFMLRHLPLSEEEHQKLAIVYRASGIQQRYSVIPDFLSEPRDFQFFPPSEGLEPFPSVSQRMTLYKQNALDLCAKASEDCLIETNKKEITHLITVSCTGMYAPGIDIELVERLGLNTNVERTAINFMGCYGAFNGLKAANHILNSNPKNKVLLVSVELCTIHMLKKTDDDSLLANALFGDGAAAVLIESQQNKPQLGIAATHADLALDAKDEMAWHIGDFGFEMKLSADVPNIIKQGIARLTTRLLDQLKLRIDDINYYAIHPGGKRILQVIEEQLGISKNQNQMAYEVLQDYGNLSSVTVLFVLKKLMNSLEQSGQEHKVLSFAFGPGLTMESMLFQISMP